MLLDLAESVLGFAGDHLRRRMTDLSTDEFCLPDGLAVSDVAELAVFCISDESVRTAYGNAFISSVLLKLSASGTVPAMILLFIIILV